MKIIVRTFLIFHLYFISYSVNSQDILSNVQIKYNISTESSTPSSTITVSMLEGLKMMSFNDNKNQIKVTTIRDSDNHSFGLFIQANNIRAKILDVNDWHDGEISGLQIYPIKDTVILGYACSSVKIMFQSIVLAEVHFTKSLLTRHSFFSKGILKENNIPLRIVTYNDDKTKSIVKAVQITTDISKKNVLPFGYTEMTFERFKEKAGYIGDLRRFFGLLIP